MKLVILSLLILLPRLVSGQTLSVKSSDIKSKEILETELRLKKQTISDSDPDIVLELLVWQTSKINSMYKGCLVAKDKKSGQEISRTKDVRRGAVAINGFNASSNIAEVIAKKYLSDLLIEVHNQIKKQQ